MSQQPFLSSFIIKKHTKSTFISYLSTFYYHFSMYYFLQNLRNKALNKDNTHMSSIGSVVKTLCIHSRSYLSRYLVVFFFVFLFFFKLNLTILSEIHFEKTFYVSNLSKSLYKHYASMYIIHYTSLCGRSCIHIFMIYRFNIQNNCSII